MDTAELIRKVRRIEIKTKGLSNQIFSGSYHSTFKGQGMSFSEVREYAYGDDVRHIDWNVTARIGQPHIKIYDEERELTVMLLIDVSQSMDFGLSSAVKREIAAEIAAIIAFSAMSNNDKVGALFFTDKIEGYLPPKKGKKNVLRIIREIINLSPVNKGSDIGEALKYFTNVQKKRSIAFLISDFIAPAYDTPLSLTAQKHDLIAIDLFDQVEMDIKGLPLLFLNDAENGHHKYIDGMDKSTVLAYKNIRLKRREILDTTFSKASTDIIHVDVSKEYIKTLIAFFKNRA